MNIKEGQIYADEGKVLRLKGEINYFNQISAMYENDIEEVAIEYAENTIKDAELSLKYGERVAELVAQKYTFSQELAIQRQREVKPIEFGEYNAYCEDCKAQAKREIYGYEQA